MKVPTSSTVSLSQPLERERVEQGRWDLPCVPFHLYCLRRNDCVIHSPGGHLCNFIARLAEDEIPPRARYVILFGHAQDTENYRFQKLIRIRGRSAEIYVILNISGN